MRLLYSIHLYPPRHNCGGEAYIHNLNTFLVSRGHHVRIMLHQARQYNIRVPYDWEGVEVMGNINHLDAYRWADVLITHLDFTHFTILLGNDIGKPVVQIVHNHHRYESVANARYGIHVVYNSEWIKNKLNYAWPSIVVPPSLSREKYDVCDNPEGNEYITMINLNSNKGGRLLQRIAKVFPDKKFLAVMGSYDEQFTEQPENVKVVPNTPDILPIYRQTRVLIMPSQYETWGMTATEAMCSGIPVVCTPTPGLKENCDYAGLYIDKRNADSFDGRGNVIDDSDDYDITSLVNMIKKLDDKKFYDKSSKLCRKRSYEHDSENNMLRYEEFLYAAREEKLKAFV